MAKIEIVKPERPLVIIQAVVDVRRITFACDQDIMTQIKRMWYGSINEDRENPRRFNLIVDERYNFNTILSVLRKFAEDLEAEAKEKP